MADNHTQNGLAFIVEGATEKVFYLEYLKHLCNRHEVTLIKDNESQEDAYTITGRNNRTTRIMFNTVNSVSQITNSEVWFHRACYESYPQISWTVFLCYDTDEYNCTITKFHEGDWDRLRKGIGKRAERIVDLAAEADIEDIILCDFNGVLDFLKLDHKTPMPNGNKGKAKLRKLFRAVAINNAYHSGEKARPLIQTLNMERIERIAPVQLKEIEAAAFR